jgi:hypothetical protein
MTAMGWRKFNGAGHAVVEVEGSLDQAACEEFTAFLTTAAEDAVARGEDLNIDLTALRDISSHGLRALACARNVVENVTLTCPEGRGARDPGHQPHGHGVPGPGPEHPPGAAGLAAGPNRRLRRRKERIDLRRLRV